MVSEYEKRVKSILDEKYRELLILHLEEKWKRLFEKLNKEQRKDFKRLKKALRLYYKYLRLVEALSHAKALEKCRGGL